MEGTRYWFNQAPNIKKLLADRRATIANAAVVERVRETVRRVFGAGAGFDRRYFPEASSDIPDSAALTLVVLAPEHGWETSRREDTKNEMSTFIQEHGTGSRTFKSALIFAVAEKESEIVDAAKNILALESLEDDIERLQLKEDEQKDLTRMKKRADEDLKESVWRTYRHVVLLDESGGMREVDLGLQHSSAAPSLTALIQVRLKQEGLLEDRVSPDFLVRNWPPALPSWPTKAVRDTFYASPKLPRLTDWTALRKTIAEGESSGRFGYASLTPAGAYDNVRIGEAMGEADIEFSDKVVLLTKDEAGQAKARGEPTTPEGVTVTGGERPHKDIIVPTDKGAPVTVVKPYAGLKWEGQVPPQKWMTFYMKVLTRFADDPSLALNVKFSVSPTHGVTQEKVDETRASLKDLGLADDVKEQPNE